MYEVFIANAKTTPFCNRDFAEWHGGISHYGFWAVLVFDGSWLELLERARSHVRQFIHPGYRRAPHITIAASGLLSDGHFTARLLESQVAALKDAKISPFSLEAGGLASFASAPYITVEDPNGSLGQIRSILAMISAEDSPAAYMPHITLGLYHDAFDTSQVAKHLRDFRAVETRPFAVAELTFCSYETRNIQGPLAVLKRVTLSGS